MMWQVESQSRATGDLTKGSQNCHLLNGVIGLIKWIRMNTTQKGRKLKQ